MFRWWALLLKLRDLAFEFAQTAQDRGEIRCILEVDGVVEIHSRFDASHRCFGQVGLRPPSSLHLNLFPLLDLLEAIEWRFLIATRS